MDVGYENDNVCGGDGYFSLLTDEAENFVVGFGFDTAGIDHGELAAVPVGVGIKSVAGDTGNVLYDGQALACQFVEEHGFAHVGASYYCYQGLSHFNCLL